MAKKKRKHSNHGGRGPAATSTSETATGKLSVKAAPESVKPTPATPGGPNRMARKEEARKERERLRKRIARRRYYRRAWQVGVATVLVGALVFFVTRPKAKLNAEEQSLFDQGTAAATLTSAGCDAVATIQPYSPEANDRAHIGTDSVPTPPPLSTYASIPPASGPHNQTPLAGGVYSDPPDIYQTIHSLEHGAVIIWYDPSAGTAQELADLQTFFQKSGEGAKVIVAPYSYPDQGGDAAALPTGKQMVLVAWHRMQTCASVSLPVAFAFVTNYDSAGKGPYRGEAPEPGTPI
jgi:hypothetical protein